MGCTVVIQHLDTKKQSFLHGHADNVSCVVVSRDGMYVASGQVTCIGFKADVILWDFPKQELLARLSLHEGKVEGLSFSPRGIYLVSLGGQDDGRVMVWDVSKREAVCGSPASPRSAGNANVVMCSSCRDEVFVTAGNFTIRVWELDTATKTIHPSECYAGQLRGISVCVQMTDDDGDFHLGTTSGDVLKVNTSSKVLTACGPQKKKLSMGVTALLLPKTGGLIVGTGEGTVALCAGSDFQVKKRMRVEGAVTSLTCRGRDDQFFLGTNKGQMHRSAYATFKEELVAVCHTEAVNDIVFPERYVRKQMILDNTLFKCVCYHRGEYQIITSGTDRKIVYWEVLDGSAIREVQGSLSSSINGMDITSDGASFVTGTPKRSPAWERGTKSSRTRCITVSQYVWDGKGPQKIIQSNPPMEQERPGGDDHLVKLWDYKEGTVTHVGVGHSGNITRLKICPANKYMVSVSADGAVLIWKQPSSG